MYEYNIETILRILKFEEFDTEKLNLNKIKHVPMHQYRVSSFEYPFLLIDNLQCCIGLYAYSKNFSFAAHLNPVVIRSDEFQCDENSNIVYCNRIDDLLDAIISKKIKTPVYIGISVGHNPIKETYEQVIALNKSIDNLIKKIK